MSTVDWNSVIERVLDGKVLVPALIMVGGVCIVTVKALVGMITSNSRERTRREIAAYIAEGTMTPEQGERLLKAGEPKESC